MSPDLAPSNAIDPRAAHREWVRSFTWHLDVVPPVMDTLVSMTLPTIPVSRGGSRFDKLQITGGGFVDNMQILDALAVNGTGQVVDAGGAVTDARELWTWVVEYTAAVNDWIEPSRPAPTIDVRLNPDPLTARGLALITVGWLIDHADQVEPIHELNEHREEMFALIRRLRGRYGVHRHPRRARPGFCEICGERAVVVDWVTGENGRAFQAGKCRNCGATFASTEGKNNV